MNRRVFIRKAAVLLLLIVILSGCGAFTGAPPAALPTVVLGSGGQPAVTGTSPAQPGPGGGVTASGVVVPARQARLVFPLAGKIDIIDVSAGESVTGGQVLARLEGQEDLQAAVSQAQFELAQAEQGLKDLNTETETARVQAMKDIIAYERAVRDAQYALDNFTTPLNQAGLDAVEALNQMKGHLNEARAAFEPYKYRPSSDPVREDRKEALEAAQADYNAAVKRLQYEYDLQVAEAQLAKAVKDYQILNTGIDPDRLKLAEARLVNAQVRLTASQAALGRFDLIAPFAGVITTVDLNPGEWVIPGQPVMVLVDLGQLQVETIDLSERDIPRIQVGQVVSVFIEALDQTVTGRVSQISPLADNLGGDVVYRTVIDLDEIPSGLRSGMSVEVQFQAGP